jgi:hypothetical protein
MNTFPQRVSGLFETRGGAEVARERLMRSGLLPVQLTMIQPGRNGVSCANPAHDDRIQQVLRNGAIGGMIGTAIGTAVVFLLAITDAALMVADPVLATLIMICWSAALGGCIGAVSGARNRKGDISDLLNVPLTVDQIVLVAHTANRSQTTSAQLILGRATRNPYGVRQAA